jgi:hypothetical protein
MPPVSERPTARSAAPAAVAIVEELTALRSDWSKASHTDQEKILAKVLGIVNDTGGSGTTNLPLRVVARDFVEGKAILDLLVNRANEHIVARTHGHIIEKGRSTGLDR